MIKAGKQVRSERFKGLSREIRELIDDAIRTTPETLAEHFLPPGLIPLGRKGNKTEWNKSHNKRGGGNCFRITHKAEAPLFSNFHDGFYGLGTRYIERHCGVGWQDAYLIAADLYKIDTGINRTPEKREELDESARAANEAKRKEEAERDAKKTQAEEAKKKGYAARYWQASQPIAPGSIADIYLTEVRGIRRPSQGWPADAIRFHAGDCALIAGISDDEGQVLTAQRIFLTQKGGRALETHEDGTVTKKQKKVLPGDRKGLRFRLAARTTEQQPENQRRIIAVCEGPETALSIWTATGFETWATIGVGSKVFPPSGSMVIYCRDNEAEGTQAYKSADDSEKQWTRSGCAVVTVWPWGEYSTREDRLKTDLNDLLLAEGEGAVRRAVLGPLNSHFADIAAFNPSYPLVSTSRQTMTSRMQEWFASGWADNRVTLINVDAGTGKTAGAIQTALKTFIKARIPGRPLVFSFPDHRLAEEKRAEIERAVSEIGASLNVKVFKGREQSGADGVPMCENIEQAREVQAAGMSASEYLCNAKNDGCPYRLNCPYVRQMQTNADIWLITHASLMINKPRNIGLPQFLIIDEPTLKNGLTGTEGKERLVSGISLPTRKNQGADQETIAAFNYWGMGEVEVRASVIRTMLEKQAEGIEQNETRYLSRGIACEYFGHVDLEGAISQTNRTIVSLKPGLEKINERANILRALGRAAALLREIKRLLDDKELAENPRIILTAGRENELLYRLTGRKEISSLWLAPSGNEADEGEDNRTPVLMLDATANLPLIKSFFPDVEIMEAIRAATPHARFTFMQGQQWGFSAQKKAVKIHEQGEVKRDDSQSIEGIRITLWRHWLRSGRKTMLAVMSKALSEYLKQLNDRQPGFLPPDCDLAHFGATRGLNKWETAGTILIFGRMLIPSDKLQMQAEAMTGRPGIRQTEQIKARKTRVLPDGRAVSFDEYFHPDEIVNAFLKTSVDGETIQAAGRGRAVNRTADNPLAVYVYADTYPDALPLDDVQQSSVITPWERMALNEAMNSGRGSEHLSPVLTAPGDAAKAFSNIWETKKAAERAFEWAGISPPNPYKNIYIRLWGLNKNGVSSEINGLNQHPVIPGLLSSCGGYIARYKPEGRGQQWRFAWVPEEWRDGFRNWIAQALSVSHDAVSLEWVEYELPEQERAPGEIQIPNKNKEVSRDDEIKINTTTTKYVDACKQLSLDPIKLLECIKIPSEKKDYALFNDLLSYFLSLDIQKKIELFPQLMSLDTIQSAKHYQPGRA